MPPRFASRGTTGSGGARWLTATLWTRWLTPRLTALLRVPGRRHIVAPRPTIRDVAARAGVSTATVSRVLAGIGNPSTETSTAVFSAVAALHYRPSSVARSLRTRRTRTFGLIVTDIQNPFYPELVQAVDLAARARGYSILLGSAAIDENRERRSLDLMVDRHVDGMIIAASHMYDAGRVWLTTSPVPAVVVNAEHADLVANLVTSDNVAGARLAVEHLIALGHRRIAYIRGAESETVDALRLAGFRDACRAAGLPMSETPEIRGDGRFEGGERAATTLLSNGHDLTGIVCFNDVTAIGALRALRSVGLRAPSDVDIIGVDDIAAASWVAPALTTVAQQKAEMGRVAVERLIAIVDDPDLAGAPETVRLHDGAPGQGVDRSRARASLRASRILGGSRVVQDGARVARPVALEAPVGIQAVFLGKELRQPRVAAATADRGGQIGGRSGSSCRHVAIARSISVRNASADRSMPAGSCVVWRLKMTQAHGSRAQARTASSSRSTSRIVPYTSGGSPSRRASAASCKNAASAGARDVDLGDDLRPGDRRSPVAGRASGGSSRCTRSAGGGPTSRAGRTSPGSGRCRRSRRRPGRRGSGTAAGPIPCVDSARWPSGIAVAVFVGR